MQIILAQIYRLILFDSTVVVRNIDYIKETRQEAFFSLVKDRTNWN